MSGNTSSGDVPDYLLERYVLRELPAAELAALERAIAADAQLAARLRALEDDSAEQQRRYPAAWMAGQIELKRAQQSPQQRRTHSRERKRGVLRGLWAIPAVALALAIVALPVWEQQVEPDTRIKGAKGPVLQVFLDGEGGVERLPDSSLVQPGDVVQLVYRSGGYAYGAIFSLDGRGALTRHLPAEGHQAVALVQGVADTLDFAYELDDAPRWERFYMVAAAHPFALDLLERALRQRSERVDVPTLDLPAEYSVSTFVLRKPDAP